MRQWRVGTLSMGLVLIMTGIILLIGKFNQFSAIKSIINLWPVILILLGLEILTYLKFAKTEQMIIKYDFLSIIFIAFLGLVTLGFYGLTTTGALDYFNEQLLMKSYEITLEETRFEIPSEVSKIKIAGAREKLKILTGNSNEIVSFGSIGVKATGEAGAKGLLPKEIFKTNIIGDTLFLEFQDNLAMHNRSYGGDYGGITLIVPKNLPLEFDGINYNRLKVEIDNLESDWLINSQGSVDVLLLNNENLKINTLVPRSSYLEGTIEWIESEDSTEDLDNEQEKYYRSNAKWGEGKYALQIISEGRVNIVTP